MGVRVSERTDSADRFAAWADGVMERLDEQEDLDGRLLHALGRGPSLREDTLTRMAEAVRAAVLGMSPAGCAVAAGVSERLLHNWQQQDPSFAAAMTQARTLARAHAGGSGTPARLTPATLHILLTGVRRGVPQAAVPSLAGLSVRALLRVRRERPQVEALILAARRAARLKKAGRRGGASYEQRYRLVRIDDAPSEG
ncbi:hypothetical protein ADL00_25965 [Streptomyces sp. AS58]|nr:hypothetical protein ADL00_25965 [Streptomyces sp. AS58]